MFHVRLQTQGGAAEMSSCRLRAEALSQHKRSQTRTEQICSPLSVCMSLTAKWKGSVNNE